MKKFISVLLSITLLITANATFFSQSSQACSKGAGEDYVFQEGVNLRNVKMPIAFTDKLAIGDNPEPVAALGNTKEYNLCPPEDGVTIMVLFRNDCQ